MIMCRFVCLGMPKCVGGIKWSKNVHAQFWAVKNDLRYPCYSFLLYGYARAALAWTKKKRDGSYRTAQVGLGDRRRKKSKTEEDGSYHSAEVSPGDRVRKKS